MLNIPKMDSLNCKYMLFFDSTNSLKYSLDSLFKHDGCFDSTFFKSRTFFDSCFRMPKYKSYDSALKNYYRLVPKNKLHKQNYYNDPNGQVLNKLKTIRRRINIIDDDINKYMQINKLIPIRISAADYDNTESNNPKAFSFIFWFDATTEFIRQLPERIRSELETELSTLQSTTDICANEAKAGEKKYFDIWRSCSGAVENLTVFPNPTSGNINISYSLTDSRTTTVAVHDLSGRTIYELASRQSKQPGEVKEMYRLNNIDPGVYLISIKTDKGEKAVQRIIVE